jgi:hypothetical protein
MAESLSGMTVLLHHAEETADEEQTPTLGGLAVHDRHVGSVRMQPRNHRFANPENQTQSWTREPDYVAFGYLIIEQLSWQFVLPYVPN